MSCALSPEDITLAVRAGAIFAVCLGIAIMYFAAGWSDRHE